ncbi:MAG: hypothetical protein ABI986_11645, partial [Chloroflexota bacterium]
YADRDRQRAEQRQGPITFLWALCLSLFFVLLAGLVLWGVWRWLRIQQSNQRILESPVAKLQPPQNEPPPYVESEIVDSHYQLTNPDDQVGQWMDEVKSKLRSDDKKDEDDHTEK